MSMILMKIIMGINDTVTIQLKLISDLFWKKEQGLDYIWKEVTRQTFYKRHHG